MLEKLHSELKIEFDKETAEYFLLLTIKNKGVIVDLEAFDAALPPMNTRFN